jgi:SAM-dependent methyltransferase
LWFATGGATAIPLQDHSVDVIVSFETIEHLDDQDTFWSEIKRVLRTNGVLLISSPNREVYSERRSKKNPFHKRELTQAELIEDVSERFAYHQLFSQTVAFGSLLVPSLPDSTSPYLISVDPATHILSWDIGDEWSHPYSVALASDEEIPATAQSFYSGTYPPGAMSALIGGIVARDQLAQDLRAQIVEFERNLTEEKRLHTLDREAASIQETGLNEQLVEADQLAQDLRAQIVELEQELTEEKRLHALSREAASIQETGLKQELVERDNELRALKAFLHDHDELILANDRCQMETTRLRETLTEQNATINAMKELLEEFGHPLSASDLGK